MGWHCWQYGESVRTAIALYCCAVQITTAACGGRSSSSSSYHIIIKRRFCDKQEITIIIIYYNHQNYYYYYYYYYYYVYTIINTKLNRVISPCVVQHKILFTAVRWPSVAVLNRIIYVCGGHKRGTPNRHSRYLPKSNTIKYYNVLKYYYYYFYCRRRRRQVHECQRQRKKHKKLGKILWIE